MVSTPKTKASRRILPLPQPVVSALIALRSAPGLETEETLVFHSRKGMPLNDTNLLLRHLKPVGRKSVLAIDCMLVETLGAFIEGLEDTEGKSKKTFCNFLRGRKLFATEFSTADLAEKFYKQLAAGFCIKPKAAVKARFGQSVLCSASKVTLSP